MHTLIVIKLSLVYQCRSHIRIGLLMYKFYSLWDVSVCLSFFLSKALCVVRITRHRSQIVLIALSCRSFCGGWFAFSVYLLFHIWNFLISGRSLSFGPEVFVFSCCLVRWDRSWWDAYFSACLVIMCLFFFCSSVIVFWNSLCRSLFWN